jgi:calcineurin-like phosphoesterase family protein
MRVFFGSDHHFFHTNIIKYCERPFRDSDHMNSEMIARWNDTVSDDDVVIYVGDLTAGLGGRVDDLHLLIKSLNGKKYLVRGNHDHQSDDWYVAAGFFKVFNAVNLGGVLFVHYSLQEAISRGFDISSFGVVEHVIHGHTHRADVPNHENHFNVAADRHNFTPVSYDVAVPQALHKSFLEAVSTL